MKRYLKPLIVSLFLSLLKVVILLVVFLIYFHRETFDTISLKLVLNSWKSEQAALYTIFSLSKLNISLYELHFLRFPRTLKFISFRIGKEIPPPLWPFLVWCDATYFQTQKSELFFAVSSVHISICVSYLNFYYLNEISKMFLYSVLRKMFSSFE